MRRIRTIALVHETLSREPGDDVAFLDIVRPLLRLTEEGLQSPDRPVRFSVDGDGGRLPGAIRDPLSVVLTESARRTPSTTAFPRGQLRAATWWCTDNSNGELHIRVINDGTSLDPGLRAEQRATGLGLLICAHVGDHRLAGRHQHAQRTRRRLRRCRLLLDILAPREPSSTTVPV